MAEQNPIQLNLDPNMYGLTGVNIVFDEMQFGLHLISGNQLRQYLASPIHAKRILLLLQKQMAAYEKQFGEIKTELPQTENQTVPSKPGFKTE